MNYHRVKEKVLEPVSLVPRKPKPVRPKFEDAQEHHKMGYCRVSTSEQDLRMQRDAMIAEGVDPLDIFEEKISGATLAKRAEFQAMMKDMRHGDIVYVWKLDRLARNAMDLYQTVEAIHRKGAKLVVLTMRDLDLDTPAGKAMFGMFAAFAEFERGMALERTLSGLKAARARGHWGGRRSKFTDEEVLAIQHLPTIQAAASLGITRAGFQKRLAKALANAAKGKSNGQT